MFLFFAISPRSRRHGYVLMHCDVHRGDAWQELASYRSWFKLLFFLPLFPVGREKHTLTCTECGATYLVDADEARRLGSRARPDVMPMTGDGAGTSASDSYPIRVPSRRLDRGA